MREVVEIAGIVFGVAGGCWGFYKAGFFASQAKNGFVKKEECLTQVKKTDDKYGAINTELGTLHEKVNKTNEGVARIEGALGMKV